MKYINRIRKFRITTKIAFVVIISLGTSSCNDFLNINTSPVTATDVDSKLLFGYAVTAWNANKCSGDYYIPIGLMTQTIASGGNFGWGAYNLYGDDNLSPYSLGNTWKVFYSTAGNNLQLAIDKAKRLNDKNTEAQCKVVLAELMYECTILYGDVPFKESWKDGIAYPAFDTQKEVFEGVISLLDEATASFDLTSVLKIVDYDIYYGGDINSWKKLAASLKLKVLMTMVDKDPTKAALIGQIVQNPANLISSSSGNWIHKYYTTTNNENPKFKLLEKYAGGKNIWFFANKTVFDPMKSKSDPRISRYFDKGVGATDYIAIGTEEEADTTIATISMNLYKKDAPDVLASYQEVCFLISEAYARGLGVSVDLAQANNYYAIGIEAAMKFYGVAQTDIDTYKTTKMVNLTTTSNPIVEIREQQWIDFMERPLDAFTLWRRSGVDGNEYPALTLPPAATAGPLIRRWPYSPDELTANPNAPTPTPQYYDKMWFDL
jgi:hypothetical protein